MKTYTLYIITLSVPLDEKTVLLRSTVRQYAANIGCFFSLDFLLEYWIDHVTFGVIYVGLIFSTRIFYRVAPGLQLNVTLVFSVSDSPLASCMLAHLLGISFKLLLACKFDIIKYTFLIVFNSLYVYICIFIYINISQYDYTLSFVCLIFTFERVFCSCKVQLHSLIW